MFKMGAQHDTLPAAKQRAAQPPGAARCLDPAWSSEEAGGGEAEGRGGTEHTSSEGLKEAGQAGESIWVGG